MSHTDAHRPVQPTAGIDRARRRSRRHRGAAVTLAAATAMIVLLPSGVASAQGDSHPQFTVYTETNAASGNQIVALQELNGTLQQVASYAAGGTGTGAGLGSQGAVTASGDFLFAVDAGSDQLSVFHISDRGALHRTDVVASGGSTPVSVTVHDNLVYVLNGGDGSVTGFRLRRDGRLAALGVHRALPGAGAAQISFDRTGSRLIVTEKATNTIEVLPVADGVAGPAVSNASSGQTPFGFAVDRRNRVIVSNAAGGASGASSLTSYQLTGATGLTAISPTVPDTQSAACWVVLSGDGRIAFTTNTGSGSISSYRLAPDGSLRLLEAVAASPGAGPIDMARSGRVLYTLSAGAHTVTTDLIGSHGRLTPAASASVPVGSVGLAVITADAQD